MPFDIFENCVSLVVVDYADTLSAQSMTSGTRAEMSEQSTNIPTWTRLRGHFWKTLKASSQTFMEQSGKKVTWIHLHTYSNSNNLKKKSLYLKKKLLVSIVADYADTRLSNFALAYLRENEKVRDTVVACSYGAQVESFKQKNGRKSRNTVPLKILYIYTFIHYLYTFWRTFSLHHTVCQLCI